jgi:hypothetical protein
MRSCLLLLVLWLALPVSLVAQEPELPHLDLIQGLREREYFDLALEYLQKLEKLKVPSEVATMLPLETARCRIGLALQERHGVERDKKILTAQAELEKFIQGNPGHPSLVEARVELAHLLFQRGRFLVLQAQMRQDRQQTEDVTRLAQEAAPLLERADLLYFQAMSQLKQRSEAPARNQSVRARTEKRRATQTYLQAQWNHAQTLFEISRRPQVSDRAAAQALFRANEILTELAKVREQNALGWAALALSAKCLEGVDDVRSAEAYRRVLAERGGRAQLGQELAKYYRILTAYDAFRKGSREGGKVVRTEAESWIKTYPASLRTRHGQHVRFMQAIVQAADYQALEEQRRNTPTHRETIDKVVRTLEQLEKGTGDIAWAAEQMMLPVMQLTGHASGALEELRTFKECLLRADGAWSRLGQASQQLANAKEETEKVPLRQQVQQYATEMLAAARRALRLMPRDVKDSDWDYAHQMLVVGYLRTGDPYRAAVLSDHLAYHARQTEASLRATVEAMKIYQYLSRNNNDSMSQERVLILAERLQKQFPTAPQTDEAREILGLHYLRQYRHAEAALVLAQVTPKHPNHAWCILRAGVASWEAHCEKMRAKNAPLRTQTPELQQALRLLEQSVTAYGLAKTPADLKNLILAQARLGEVYATLSETDKMLVMLSPLLDRMQTDQLPPDLAPEIKPRVLGLALRGYVEKKDFQRGVMRVFEILKKEPNPSANNALLRSLGLQLRAQLTELQKVGPNAQTELAALQEGFRQLLHLVESNPQLLSEMRSWLADSYAALGEHRKALEFYQAMPERKPAEEVQLLRLLRQAWESVPAAEKADWLSVWEQHVQRISAQSWASRSPYFLRESLLLLEAQNKLSGDAGAVKGWYKFRAVLKPYADPKHKDSTPALRQLYHESHYHFLRCRVQEVYALPPGPERTNALTELATQIKQVQKANYGLPEFKPQYEKLLAEHPDLQALVQR